MFTNYIILLSFITNLYAITLQSIYEQAVPYNGYDKYLILEKETIYTGGIGIFEGNIFIEGNGAIIDLEKGGGIWIYADEYSPASLNIEYCTLVNGEYYGLSFAGTSIGEVTNCNFINNDFGISLYDYADVFIKNSNFINNNTYGLGFYGITPTIRISYSNAWGNTEGNWFENCPG